MKKNVLLILLLSAGFSAFATTVVITNSGFNFTPATITITFGDSVRFTVATIHHPLEVSEATWNANGNTPLNGGFELNNGGGLLLPANLPVGTHFYVCEPHASGGMKGIIIVQGATATEDFHFPAEVSIYPNPTIGTLVVNMSSNELSKTFDLSIYTIEGKRVYVKSRSEMELINTIDLTGLQKGAYILRLNDGKNNYSKQLSLQ